MTTTRDPFATRIIGWILTVGGLIGGVAAFVLVLEKIELLEDPNYRPTCSINPVLSCGSVMVTDQASVFGFPNPVIGVMAFPVVITIGLAVLAGLKFPRWWWLGFQLGALCGLGFIHWLYYQSLYEIHALCPYCMVVWVVTITIFWYTTLFNLYKGYLPVPAGAKSFVDFLIRNHTVILLVWFIILAVFIGEEFWSYWRTLL